MEIETPVSACVSIVIFVKIIIIMERPQNGPPLLKVYLKDGQFGPQSLQRLRAAVMALGRERPQTGPPLLIFYLKIG